MAALAFEEAREAFTQQVQNDYAQNPASNHFCPGAGCTGAEVLE